MKKLQTYPISPVTGVVAVGLAIEVLHYVYQDNKPIASSRISESPFQASLEIAPKRVITETVM